LARDSEDAEVVRCRMRPGEPEEVAVGHRDVGSPHEIAGFGRWSLDGCPARRTALAVLGHGAGMELRLKMASFPDPETRSDMDVVDLGKALDWALGHDVSRRAPIDVILFDSCELGLLDYAYELALFARV